MPNHIFRDKVLFSQGHRSVFFVCGSGSGSRGKEAKAVDGLAASSSLLANVTLGVTNRKLTELCIHSEV